MNTFESKIEITKADITKLEVDAIVNAANTSLLGGGGVDGAIHRAAGPGLLEECRKIGGCPTGEARITKGYNLPASHVIHTPGPVYSGSANDSILLTDCYKNCLAFTLTHPIGSIAFPAISCGVYGYPVEEASRIAIETTLEFLKNKNPDLKVIFALFSDEFVEIYKKSLIRK